MHIITKVVVVLGENRSEWMNICANKSLTRPWVPCRRLGAAAAVCASPEAQDVGCDGFSPRSDLVSSERGG